MQNSGVAKTENFILHPAVIPDGRLAKRSPFDGDGHAAYRIVAEFVHAHHRYRVSGGLAIDAHADNRIAVVDHASSLRFPGTHTRGIVEDGKSIARHRLLADRPRSGVAGYGRAAVNDKPRPVI